MIAPIDERYYDCEGRVTLLPKKGSLNFHPTFAMGTYVTCECAVTYESLEDVRGFLRSCRYASDYRQFGVPDYWMRPDQFEESRTGDCEDFSLWTWRQLLAMGYDARFVLGRVGYGRQLHAWVSFVQDGTHYLVEPVAARYRKLSRLSVMLHEPELSVAYESGRLVYRQHEPRDYRPLIWRNRALRGRVGTGVSRKERPASRPASLAPSSAGARPARFSTTCFT